MASLLSGFFVLSACGPAPMPSNPDKIRSAKQAMSLLSDAGGIETRVFVKPNGERKTSSFNTTFFNMGFTSQNLPATFNIVVDLGNSPAAQKIKAEGKPVYSYIRPRYQVWRKYGTKEPRGKVMKVILPDTGLCDGYYVVLHPGNNYQRSWTYNRDVEVRSKTTGADMGIWGSGLGAQDWVAMSIDDVYTTKHYVSDTPFRKDTGRSIFDPCYPDKATREAWKR